MGSPTSSAACAQRSGESGAPRSLNVGSFGFGFGDGCAVKARISGPASSSRAAASGKRVSSWPMIRRCCSRADSASGWAKIVRTIVATNDWALFGTRVSRLRMKCVRQRCHEAPGKVAAIASTSPGCASEVTSLTPARPRATSERRKASQAAPSSEVTTARPSDSRTPSRLTATACTTQTLTVRPRSRHLTSNASSTKYGYGARPSGRVRKSADDLVERLRQPGDLALRHPLDPELLHQLLHPPRRDARKIRIGDHRHERLLRASPRLQQPVGKVRPLTQLRHRELDRAHTRVPLPLAIAVAAVEPLRRPLAVAGATARVRLSASAKSCTIARNRSGLACSSCLRSQLESSIVVSTTVPLLACLRWTSRG
jgi:hypothetical protein